MRLSNDVIHGLVVNVCAQGGIHAGSAGRPLSAATSPVLLTTMSAIAVVVIPSTGICTMERLAYNQRRDCITRLNQRPC